ncbi:hypothetical protein J4573_45035 [Actinomadura barringtoniae]|uniref:WXG100 family type VII secretion target n=1 Tax=Actinomadura barringtoniae TaxID=1427535 RepID=A0A939PLK2_9ACTN|nr:hypothetical protein [Actinomadura barringtoniae]MBO2454318.1 hypothetical protein [Actinomadura barringtoniae]
MSPQGSTDWDGDMDAMNGILDACQPGKVKEAANNYTAAGDKFKNAAGVLGAQMTALSGVWKGDDADATIEQMRNLQTSASGLQSTSTQTGKTLDDHATKLQWYKDHKPGKGMFGGFSWKDGLVAVAPAGLPMLAGKKIGEAFGLIDSEEDKAAKEHMKRLSERTIQANTAMPERLSTNLPSSGVYNVPPPNNSPGATTGGVHGGGGGSGSFKPPNSGGSGQFTPPGDHGGSGQFTPPGSHGGQYTPPGSHGGSGTYDPNGGNHGGSGTYDPHGGRKGGLAGLPGGGGGAGGGDPFGKGGLGGGGAGGAGSMPGGGAGGAGSMPGGGAGGLAGGMPGAGARGAGAGGLGSGKGAAGRGGMGGGMGGAGRGGGGKGEEEQERSTWLSEDEDVWGGNDGDTAPPVIG